MVANTQLADPQDPPSKRGRGGAALWSRRLSFRLAACGGPATSQREVLGGEWTFRRTVPDSCGRVSQAERRLVLPESAHTEPSLPTRGRQTAPESPVPRCLAHTKCSVNIW